MCGRCLLYSPADKAIPTKWQEYSYLLLMSETLSVLNPNVISVRAAYEEYFDRAILISL